jgi:cytochrome c-type biogenesis protein CcmH
VSTGRSAERSRASRLVLLAWLLGLWLAPPLLAQSDLEEQVRAVASELRCPVCQNLSVADSPSEMAREMVVAIREQLRAGKTPEEVKAYFLSKYGDWILLSPRPRGLNLLVWLGPFAGVVLGLALAAVSIRRWMRTSKTAGDRVLDPALVERIRREVRGDAEPGLSAGEGGSPLVLERDRLYADLREIEFDYRSGKLSRADYEAMRDDYEARAAAILAELDRRTAAPAAPSGAIRTAPPAAGRLAGQRSRPRLRRLVVAAAFLLVFGFSIGYFLTGSLRPRMGGQDTPTGDFLTGTGPGGIMPGSGQPMRHLEMLMASGRQAYEREDWRAAIDAFKQALAVEPDQPEALAFLGLILLQAGHVDDALASVERALASQPGDRFALWARGLVLFHGKQDYAEAVKTWESLMASRVSAEDADRIAQMITEARKRLAGGSPEPPRALASPRGISGTVTLAPSVGAQSPPGSALFVIARRGSGPPIAVKRIPDPTFPAAFSLGAEDQMLGGGPFEGEVTLLARLKRDGKAGPPAPGDFVGEAKRPVKLGERGVKIILDQAR